MSERTPDDVYDEIMQLGPRSAALRLFALERANKELREALEKIKLMGSQGLDLSPATQEHRIASEVLARSKNTPT